MKKTLLLLSLWTTLCPSWAGTPSSEEQMMLLNKKQRIHVKDPFGHSVI